MVKRLNVPGPKARAIVERDARVVSPAYGRDYPFVMSHGQGTEVWDVDGNRYLDFVAGIAVNATGHNHPKVVRAIEEQLKKFIHISSDFYHPIWVETAEKLNEIAPFQEDASMFMTNSGTESVEAAIKLARYHTGRERFIGFLGGFHGRTSGSLAFTSSKYIQQRGFTTVANVTHIPFPNTYRQILAMQPSDRDYGDTVVNYLENVIFETRVPADEVAAILVEPIQGEGGYIVPPPSFFPRLRQVCDKHGILLIADEVQAGMGRTGRWWSIENWGIEPDIVASAKGIASGMPFGAMIARKSVMTWKQGSHGNTYGGNPLACAASLATIDVLENDGGLDNAREQGEYMLDALAEIMERHPSIGDVRGIGLMIGIEFVEDRTTKAPAKDLRNRVIENLFQHGLLTLGAGQNVIRFAPPLTLSRSEVNEGLEIIEHAITLAEQAHEKVLA